MIYFLLTLCGQRRDDGAVIPREAELRLQSADHALALVHRVVCEFRGSYGRGARQSASRHAAQSPLRNDSPASAAERDDRDRAEFEAASERCLYRGGLRIDSGG